MNLRSVRKYVNPIMESLPDKPTVKYISGNMVDGNPIALEIDGKRITRTLRYSHKDGLYIVYKNHKYFEYEFLKDE
jgi:hypothetical protein